MTLVAGTTGATLIHLPMAGSNTPDQTTVSLLLNSDSSQAARTTPVSEIPAVRFWRAGPSCTAMGDDHVTPASVERLAHTPGRPPEPGYWRHSTMAWPLAANSRLTRSESGVPRSSTVFTAAQVRVPPS